MIRFIVLMPACAIAVMSTTATARSRYHSPPATHLAAAHLSAPQSYRPRDDPNAVFVGGTYAGSDPDPNIRAALIRGFGPHS
jgi:hypothetical protein